MALSIFYTLLSVFHGKINTFCTCEVNSLKSINLKSFDTVVKLKSSSVHQNRSNIRIFGILIFFKIAEHQKIARYKISLQQVRS